MHTLSDLQAGLLNGASHIKIAAQLEQFPKELFELVDSLEILDLSGNQLCELPDDFARFTQLRILFLSNNQFQVFPKVLAQCPNLSMVGFKSNHIHTLPDNALPNNIRWLILTDNALTQLPANMGHYQQLQKCMLAGNHLTTLPNSMAQCVNLELLRISANRLSSLPNWLTQLPKLSWLAFAGNPCSGVPVTSEQLPDIAWQELQIEQRLGEGASGFISKARWQDQYIAVKEFKGQVTSDGYPSDEMNAAMAAGQHPNLVKLLGKLSGHKQQGLLFELIPPSFENLAGPPSFTSCTRDIYAQQQIFSYSYTYTLLRNVASAAQHLHQRNIMHGDLYGHNLLVNPQGECLLGDFGAATCYSDLVQAALLERIEVRAFACLMEELLSRTNQNIPTALSELQLACFNPQVDQRPSFAEISAFFNKDLPLI